MNVTEVIAAARDWVGQHAATDPGFVGAHLLGSINSMQPGDAFPEYLDVDIAVLLSGQTPAEGLSLPYRGLLRENREILHKGLIIEAVYLESEIYENPENVLSNPTLAYDMRSGNILADPSGGLTLTQQKVVDGFSRRIWVKARCEEEKLLATGSLRGGAAAESIGEKVFYLSWGATCDRLHNLPTSRDARLLHTRRPSSAALLCSIASAITMRLLPSGQSSRRLSPSMRRPNAGSGFPHIVF